MSSSFTKNMEKKLLLFFLLLPFSFLAGEASAEDTSVSKETIAVNVSTVDHQSWYDDRCTNGIDDDKDGKIDSADSNCDGGTKGLNPNVICDKDANKESGYLSPFPTNLRYTPCDKDGAHDDYYSTSTSNESYVQPTDKNFTIKVSASDPSGIDSIKIEWISGASVKREGGSYWDPIKLEEYRKIDKDLKPHKSSFTCSNAQSCEICVVGGACAHPVIPTGDLGIAGKQQIIFFRAVITDGAMNIVTTGFDETGVNPKLDKFYRFVICSTSCNTDPDKCTNNNPIVSLLGYEKQLSCDGPLYTLKWQFEDKDQESRPSAYNLEVRDKSAPGVVYSAVRTAKDGLVCEDTCGCDGYYTKCTMSATLFKGFLQTSDGVPVNIEYNNKTYEWRVKAYDDSKEKYCLGVSEWSPWSSASGMNFTTPSPAPVVSFTMKNSDATPRDCASGGCKFLEDINFASNSTISSNTSVASYSWVIDGKTISNKISATKNFPEGEAKHSVSLTVKDKQGITCTKQEELNLSGGTSSDDSEKENAGWNEIAPGKEYGS